MNSADAYSQVANKQLDSLEAGSDVDLYNAVLDACELIFRLPAQAQARSTAITTAEGIRLRLPVAAHPPYKVSWSCDGRAAHRQRFVAIISSPMLSWPWHQSKCTPLPWWRELSRPDACP